jgi:hypothetical protein
MISRPPSIRNPLPVLPVPVSGGRRAAALLLLQRLGEVAEGPAAGPLDDHGAEDEPGDQQQEDREAARRARDHGQQPDLQHQPGGDAQRQEGAQAGAPGPVRRGCGFGAPVVMRPVCLGRAQTG